METTDIQRTAEARIPTQWGEFQMLTYSTDVAIAMPHVVLYRPQVRQGIYPMLRVHSECMTGDVFGSLRCDCRWQLHAALDMIGRQGGILIYLRQEGRGIGLANKLHAYNLQDQGLDTAQANVHLGFDIDRRSYEDALFILRDLNISKVRLLTNNPEKIEALQSVVVGRVPLVMPAHPESEAYLRTKREVFGHLL